MPKPTQLTSARGRMPTQGSRHPHWQSCPTRQGAPAPKQGSGVAGAVRGAEPARAQPSSRWSRQGSFSPCPGGGANQFCFISRYILVKNKTFKMWPLRYFRKKSKFMTYVSPYTQLASHTFDHSALFPKVTQLFSSRKLEVPCPCRFYGQGQP